MKANWLSNVSSCKSRSSSNTINEGNIGFWDNAPMPMPPKKPEPKYYEDFYKNIET